MSPKKSTTPFDAPTKSDKLAGRNMSARIQDWSKNMKKGVQNFADFQGEETHKRFDTMIDQTIYIVKLEPSASDTYGGGWKVYFKDIPGEKATYDCNVYGQYVVPQLDSLYQMTNNGERISLDSPIRTTIRKAGKTYKFE